MHYYNRYANHEQSAKLDKDIYLKTEKKMTQLQNSSGMSWIEVQFLDSASQALQQCRQTLKWTYAFAYYLARNNLTEIFEDNQKDLEMAVENLSEMFEKPIDQLKGLKVDMLDKTAPDYQDLRINYDINYAIALFKLEDYGKAYTILENLLPYRTHMNEIYNNLGLIEARQGRFQQAIGQYRRVAYNNALAVGLEVAALLAVLPHLSEAEHAVSVSTAVTLPAQARRGRDVAFRGTLDRRTGRSAFTSVTAVCDGVVVARAQVVKAVVGFQPG